MLQTIIQRSLRTRVYSSVITTCYIWAIYAVNQRLIKREWRRLRGDWPAPVAPLLWGFHPREFALPPAKGWCLQQRHFLLARRERSFPVWRGFLFSPLLPAISQRPVPYSGNVETNVARKTASTMPTDSYQPAFWIRKIKLMASAASKILMIRRQSWIETAWTVSFPLKRGKEKNKNHQSK